MMQTVSQIYNLSTLPSMEATNCKPHMKGSEKEVGYKFWQCTALEMVGA